MKKFLWTRIFLDEFDRLAGLTEQDKQILEDRMMKVPMTQTVMKMNISESTYGRRVSEMQQKYDLVQPFSKILPVRIADSETEKYIDTH